MRLVPGIGGRFARLFAMVLAFAGLAASCERATGPVLSCEADVTDACWQFLGLAGSRVTAVTSVGSGIVAGTYGDGVFSAGPTYDWQFHGLARRWITQVGSDGRQLWASVSQLYPDTTSAVLFSQPLSGVHPLGRTAWSAADGGVLVSAPFQISAFSFALSKRQPGRITLGHSIAIRQSLDEGSTWSYVFGFPSAGGLAQIGLWESAVSGTRMYSGCGTGNGTACFMSSVDAGQTWEQTFPWGPRGRDIAVGLAVNASDDDDVTVVLANSVVRSRDGGKVWTVELDAPSAVSFRGLVLSGDSVMYAVALVSGGRAALFRRDPASNSWVQRGVPAMVAEPLFLGAQADGRLLVGTTSGLWRVRVAGSQ